MNRTLGVRNKEGFLVSAGATGESQGQPQRQECCRFGVGRGPAELGKLGLSCL